MSDIRKSSKSPDTQILRQGQTKNGAFGSDPGIRVKGSRPVSDITVPMAKR